MLSDNPCTRAPSTCAPVSSIAGIASLRLCVSWVMISTPDCISPGSCAAMPAARSERISPAAASMASGPPSDRAVVSWVRQSVPHLTTSVRVGSSSS